jgi:hypothetical protein
VQAIEKKQVDWKTSLHGTGTMSQTLARAISNDRAERWGMIG